MNANKSERLFQVQNKVHPCKLYYDAATNPTATLLVSCHEQPGVLNKIANFIYSNGGNIIHAAQHTDFKAKLLITRIEWQLDGFNLPRGLIAPAFQVIAEPLQPNWQLHFSDPIPRIAIFVSRQDHCLFDLIRRQRNQEFYADIALIISNHPELKAVADHFGIDYHYIPITKENKAAKEAQKLDLLRHYNIDLVVLAKYMQILTPDFINQFPRIINIHHSFIPAFIGANPYHRAYERGVKFIGTTAHYVTADLDAGPIIEQDVVRVSHRDDVDDLIRKGKDLERVVLARAVRLHLQNRVFVCGNSTAIFD